MVSAVSTYGYRALALDFASESHSFKFLQSGNPLAYLYDKVDNWSFYSHIAVKSRM